MEIVKIQAYKYKELSQTAKINADYKFDEYPFDYEIENKDGEYITKYEYFSDWSLDDRVEHCELNEYLFDKEGNLLNDKLVIKGA